MASTLVWAIAAGLSFLALFLRAGVLGVPLGAALSLGALVQALAARYDGDPRITAIQVGLLGFIY